MTRAEFARHMGVNRSTVTRWIDRGRLSVDAKGLIDPVAAQGTLAATESPEPHHQARIAQIADEKAAQAAQASTQGEGREAVAMRLKLAMAKEREAKAEMAAMDRDKQAGLLVERGQVDYVMRDIGNVLRSLIEGMPDRLAPALAAHNGDTNAIRAGLEDAAHELLHQINAHMARRADDMAAT